MLLRRNNEAFFSNLKVLKCRSSSITSSCGSLCDFLECLTRLEALDIGENYLSEDYIMGLLSRISKLEHLREIMLDSVLLDLHPRYCGSFSQVYFPPSLQLLCISHNNFSSDFLGHILRCSSGFRLIQ